MHSLCAKIALWQKILIYGNFNVLHAGHIRLFRFAKKPEKLIIAVNSDRLGSDASYVPDLLRLKSVVKCPWVDDAFINDDPIPDLIARIKPDIVVMGYEHQFSENNELEAIKKVGGTLMFYSDFGRAYIPDEIIERDGDVESHRVSIPENYFRRHNMGTQKLHQIIKQFSNLRVCVIGDIIVDEYIDCDAVGLSREEPTIVVSPVGSKRFIGGAGIVALHCASLGANTHFLSVIGTDEIAGFVKSSLQMKNLTLYMEEDANRNTILKQRFRCENKSLLRVNHVPKTSINFEIHDKILDSFSKLAANLDLLIFSDFNYGCLPADLVDQIVGYKSV